MQSICSTTNPSVLRDHLMKFILEDYEKEFSTKASLTNKLLQILCISERQVKKQHSAISKECPNAKRCGVDGCLSTHHSGYLHENSPHHLRDRSQGQLNVNTSPFRPDEKPNSEPGTLQATGSRHL